MTPRQIFAYMIVSGRRLRHEKAAELNLMATAVRSEPKHLTSVTKELMQDR